MPPVADVDGDAAESGFEDGVSGVALHVIGGLIEVAHAGDVVLEQACRGVWFWSCHAGDVVLEQACRGVWFWSCHAGDVVLEQACRGVWFWSCHAGDVVLEQARRGMWFLIRPGTGLR